MKMESTKEFVKEELKCGICDQTFSRKFNLNRHLKNKHSVEPVVLPTAKQCRILCILCASSSESLVVGFQKYKIYLNHLRNLHHIEINERCLNFNNNGEFDCWLAAEKRCVNYVKERKYTCGNATTAYYNCNRSNSRGFVSNCQKNVPKTGGSIKIRGTCPSRIIATFLPNGPVLVKYIETHVGHEMEVRAERLSKNDQEYLLEQLQAGVSHERILKNARDIKNGEEFSKLNFTTRKDLNNLAYRYNIDKVRHHNDLIATSLKVNEWNSDGKNYGFLFKQIGETHPLLKKEDFALAFMNSSMERKFREFSRIVCIDGTHGLSRYRGWELTTLLVKDETKAGFPVAFMISNRKDQKIQEIFLGALKQKMGEDIKTEYFMSDDDVKYYNAWIKTMNNTPRRLICSWHVIKNWNIQGKKKLKLEHMRKTMKTDLRKILTAPNVEDFIKFSKEYFIKLKNEKETDFIGYLHQYYFNTDERIQSWAYCYRFGVGINTNMALESLNRYIKKEKLNGIGNVRLEKLLNVLEEVVDDKMWKRILCMKRPQRNTYQGRIVVKAHKKGEDIKENVQEKGSGYFAVRSSTSDKDYNVLFKEICSLSNCQEMFCQKCLVCYHKYSCECVEYLVKSTTCKHVHAVALYEREKQKSFAGNENLGCQQIMRVKEKNEEEVFEFITERNHHNNTQAEDEKAIVHQQALNYLNFVSTLEDNQFKDFHKKFQEFTDKFNKEIGLTSMKRKLDKQSYFPCTKRRRD